MADVPERQPLKIKVGPKVRVKKKLPIRIKPKEEKPAEDPPAMSLFRRAVELRRKVADRDPTLKTTTRMIQPDVRITKDDLKTESFFDRVFEAR